MNFFAKLLERLQAPTENPFHQNVRQLVPSDWSIDVREPDRVRVQAEGPDVPPWMVTIREHRRWASCSAYYDVRFPPGCLPSLLSDCLLKRNREMEFGAWMTLETPEYSTVLVRYHTDLRLMTPAMFQCICLSLAAEIAFLDSFLDQQGLTHR